MDCTWDLAALWLRALLLPLSSGLGKATAHVQGNPNPEEAGGCVPQVKGAGADSTH